MKITLGIIIITIVLLTGCTYNYPYSRSSIGTCHPVPDVNSQYSLVNNCGYRIDVHQDGRFIGIAHPGQVMPIKGPLLWRKTVVTVTGYDFNGSYIGADSWIYEFGTPEAWTVHRLNKPRRPQ